MLSVGCVKKCHVLIAGYNVVPPLKLTDLQLVESHKDDYCFSEKGINHRNMFAEFYIVAVKITS